PRKKLVTALAITMIVTLVVAVSTEGLRNYMQFSWQISEGDQFVYDVSLTGHYQFGSSLLLNLAPLNNTQVQVEIVSLHNISPFIIPLLKQSLSMKRLIQHILMVREFMCSDIPQ
ncbi:MAG: hypothetical protein ACTSR9_19345, partial [Candidatus Thorarchaeota archaeon]